MSVPDFLEWAEAHPAPRHELLDGERVAMALERLGHARRKLELCQLLQRAVERAGRPCEVLIDGVGVATDEQTVLIPDVLVRCGAPIDPEATIVPDPVIIVEVLSPSTRAIDLTDKLERYFQLPSLMHYLVARTTSPVVIHHRRTEHGLAVEIRSQGVLQLDPPGITLDLEQP